MLKFEYTIQMIYNVKNAFCFRIKNPDEVEMAEDFDELTQSSDTATDDIDSPTSGYRHASLLIQKLDSATLGTDSNANLCNNKYLLLLGLNLPNLYV